MTFYKGHTLARKSYINYELQERECVECGEIKPFSEYSIANGKYYRSTCKVCRAKYTSHIWRVNQMKKHPNSYKECSNEDCNYIWCISRSKQQCPKCGSTGE